MFDRILEAGYIGLVLSLSVGILYFLFILIRKIVIKYNVPAKIKDFLVPVSEETKSEDIDESP